MIDHITYPNKSWLLKASDTLLTPLRIACAGRSVILMDGKKILEEKVQSIGLRIFAGFAAFAICPLIFLALTVKWLKQAEIVDALQAKIPERSLVDPKSMQEFSPHIHQLCEMNTEGVFQKCSVEKAGEILNELKDKNRLDVINSIPEYFVNNSYRKSVGDKAEPLHTPLQYWAAKGHLPMVKILIDNGAADYCTAYEGLCGMTKSALYAAALNGNISVVNYLLECGAHADIAFNDNILFSFIPYFVFVISRKDDINENSLECLKMILSNLNFTAQESLKRQLKIPVSDNRNCIDYVAFAKPNNYGTLIELLKSFGGIEKDVLTNEQLREQKCIVGPCYLVDMARAK